VPHALRELYADRALITSRDLRWQDDAAISAFEPLDAMALDDARRELRVDGVVIATTDFGDAIHLRPGAAARDVVFVTHHDGGDTEVFAESVAAMLVTLRASHSR
jgi:hypothetical protein